MPAPPDAERGPAVNRPPSPNTNHRAGDNDKGTASLSGRGTGWAEHLDGTDLARVVEVLIVSRGRADRVAVRPRSFALLVGDRFRFDVDDGRRRGVRSHEASAWSLLAVSWPGDESGNPLLQAINLDTVDPDGLLDGCEAASQRGDHDEVRARLAAFQERLARLGLSL